MRFLVLVVHSGMWHRPRLLNTGGCNRLGPLDEGRGHTLVIFWAPAKNYSKPSDPTFVICAQLSPPWKYQLRSSSAYGPSDNSKPWWPPGRALDWGAGAWRRWAGCQSPLRWKMSLKPRATFSTLNMIFYKKHSAHDFPNFINFKRRDAASQPIPMFKLTICQTNAPVVFVAVYFAFVFNYSLFCARIPKKSTLHEKKNNTNVAIQKCG